MCNEEDTYLTRKRQQTRFIYNGWYYPVIRCTNVCFEGYDTKVVIEKKLGGYIGLFSWLPYVGIKCKLKDPDRPYKQKVIDTINHHPEMELTTWHPDDKESQAAGFYMHIVRTKDTGAYIGDIRDAYFKTNMHDFRTHREGSSTVCAGYDPFERKACGWSHRAMVCFRKGDKLFEEDYGDENTPFNQHGHSTIVVYRQLMESAVNFARYVA